MPDKSRLRRSISQWANPNRQEAQGVLQESRRAGNVTIAEAPDRVLCTVTGTVRTVTLRPRGGVPALEAELYDGTGILTLLWLGRRRIVGVHPGRSLSVTARISEQGGNQVMFNPRYTLGY